MGLTGYIAKILSFNRVVQDDVKTSNVKIDIGGGITKNADHFSPPGDDSQPLNTDKCFFVRTHQTGNGVIVGYFDPISDPKALPGEKRTYARDLDGNSVNEMWLKNNGDIEINNSQGGSIKMAGANGTIDLNGVTIDKNGILTVDGKVINDHVHPAGILLDSIPAPVTGSTGAIV